MRLVPHTHPLRDRYRNLKIKRNDLGKISERDPQFQTKKAEFDTWYAGQKAQVAKFYEKAVENQVYGINQRAPHKYEVVPAASVAAKSQAQKILRGSGAKFQRQRDSKS